jgi:hypothetical protein
MPETLIDDKYKQIEASYGKEAVRFIRKVMSIFARARGNDSVLWTTILKMYQDGEIIVFRDDEDVEKLRNKILLKPAVAKRYQEGYLEHAAFGFINEQGSPIFADMPFSLYKWEGEVNSLITSILDLGKAFHIETISDITRRSGANESFNLFNSFQITNRLSDRINATHLI